MSKEILKKGFSASAAIFISRITGLVRDILLAVFLGGGTMMSAWVIAFKIPNTFRRFFGEGAASQALIPILGEIKEQKGIDRTKKSFGIILSKLGLFLALISIISSIFCLFLQSYFINVERVYYALKILPVLMPYMFFVCLTGLCSGVLNLVGKFFLPALSSVILNLSIILTLLIFVNSSPQTLLRDLSLAVLASGIIQLTLMLLLLKKQGVFPKLSLPKLFSLNPEMKNFIMLVIPAMMGAAAIQINTLIDSFIAVYLNEYAAPALYYSERLIQLPVGIFAVAIGNAALVSMSRYKANNNYEGLLYSLNYSLKHALYISIPIAVFFLFFRESIIKLFFSGYKFGGKEIKETAWAMLFLSLAIPAYAGLKIVTSAFYSLKNMKTPVKVSIYCTAINFILNLCLMYPMKQGGIALSTTITSFLNIIILMVLLNNYIKVTQKDLKLKIIPHFLKFILFSFLAGIIAYLIINTLEGNDIFSQFNWRGLLTVLFASILFLLTFLGLNKIFKTEEQKEWFQLLLKNKT